MLPKIIHLIWLGNNKSDLEKKCTLSVYKHCLDYQIIEWDESNIDFSEFSKVSRHEYDKFYSNGKYAFCSDIARMYILNKYGGIYVDSDVEFIKPIQDIVISSPCLCRCNPSQEIGNGYIWGCYKSDKFVSACIRWFDEHSIKNNYYGKQWIINDLLNAYFSYFGYNIKDKCTQNVIGYKVLSSEYFCPINYINKKLFITDNTIAIHHFKESWRVSSGRV